MITIDSTIYVVDDEPSVCVGLARLLKSVGLKVKTYYSAQEFLEQVDPVDPGCLLVDLRMPGMSGLELQERLLSRNFHLPVIMLTAYGTVPASVQAMKKGAMDFLTKPVDDQQLLDAIFKALDKDRDNRQKTAEIKIFQDNLSFLSPREYEVFTLIITGISNKLVAQQLGTTEKTVKVHRARIMEKMHCDSLAELVRISTKAGMI